jgi:hypothetical protein
MKLYSKNSTGRGCGHANTSAFRSIVLAMVLTALMPSAHAAPVTHSISAGNITVIQNDLGNTAASVSPSVSLPINDFRIRSGSSRGDFNIQVGSSATDDVAGGVLVSSVAENGRDMGDPTYSGIQFATSHVDDGAGGYFIPVATTWAGGTATIEWNINLAAAWFPYSQYLGAYIKNTNNGGALIDFRGSPGLTNGIHFVDNGAGVATVNLTSKGINSQTDGVLMVVGAKNEDNFGLVRANANGTWTLYSKDNGGATGPDDYERDPFTFVFIPKTDMNLISGRFLGDASITMHNGVSPQFTVTTVGTGEYELKITGHSPITGVLLTTPEGGVNLNRDNIVSYQPNVAGDGWTIQTRTLPGMPPALEDVGTEPVASFVFIPGPTPGFIVTPTNGLLTTESSGQAAFTVALEAIPTADVTIDLTSSDPGEGTPDPSFLTFTPANWNTPQTVTVTGQDDGDTDGSVEYTIILGSASSSDSRYNDLDPVDVTILNADNEGGITVSPTSGLVTTEAGGPATFTIRLNTQPAAEVTVGFTSSDTTEGTVSPADVTFNDTNWDQPVTITVTGVNDNVDDGDVSYSIQTGSSTSADSTYNNINPPDISVINTDNDTAGFTVSTTGIAVVEGGTTNYTVVLNTEPAAAVTVNVVSSDTVQGGTVTTPVTFNSGDWNTPKPVTITGANDTVVDGNTAFTITNTITSSDTAYNALAPITVSATTLDNEGVITLPMGDAYYSTVSNLAVVIDGRARISDPYSAHYNGGTLTIAVTGNTAPDDHLQIRNVGTAPGQISVSGNVVSYGGVAIGTFTEGMGNTPLVVTFNSTAATPVAAEALLRCITFHSLNGTPPSNRRTVTVTLVDGDGGTSTATTGVRVGLLTVTSFQEGADHGYGIYTGAADVQMQYNSPNTSFATGGANGLFIDFPAPGGNSSHVMLRFDNILGENPGQVPTNAVIVSAELFVRINNTGDGSPLYRMLRSWDANAETWTTMNNGVDPDGVDASFSYDSQIGLEDGSGATGTGIVSVGVTPDVVAWANGLPNNGWGMTGWPGRNDGTAFSPSEAPIIDDRPRLRVAWLPAGTANASFRQGVDGYASAHDTRLRATEPDVNFGTATLGSVDFEVTANMDDNEHLLFRFDDIIGINPGQVPPNAVIHAAILDLASTVNSAMGDGGQFFAMLQAWDDTTITWNSAVNGIQNDGVEAATTATTFAGYPALNPQVQGAFHSFEVGPDVQAWVNGVRPNYGWAIVPWPNGNDGWAMALSETEVERDRPRLRVFYGTGTAVENITLLKPIVTQSSVQVRFTGVIGDTYSVRRASTVSGPYDVIGTGVVQGDGIGTVTDNSPLSSGAFYRVSKP